MLFSVLHIALNEPLAELYYGRSESDVLSRWGAKVGELKPKLLELYSEVTEKPGSVTSNALWELTEKKLRLKDFERILTEGGDLPLKD